jgi:hypothetical protein
MPKIGFSSLANTLRVMARSLPPRIIDNIGVEDHSDLGGPLRHDGDVMARVVSKKNRNVPFPLGAIRGHS